MFPISLSALYVTVIFQSGRICICIMLGTEFQPAHYERGNAPCKRSIKFPRLVTYLQGAGSGAWCEGVEGLAIGAGEGGVREVPVEHGSCVVCAGGGRVHQPGDDLPLEGQGYALFFALCPLLSDICSLLSVSNLNCTT